MALPLRLWLPDSQLESAVGARGLARAAGRGSLATGLWPTLPGGSLARGAVTGSASSSTPRTLPPGGPDAPRVRRRALWRGEAGLPDRPVLVEWFPLSQLAHERSAAARVRGACHAQLLGLLALGAADARSGYAISEASDGVDLATVARAAPGELPTWWAVHVIAQLCRAVQFLVDTQGSRGLPCVGHGRISASTVFIGWNGSVQLLAFAAAAQRSEETTAPELRAAERLLTPAADVYALAVLLRQLLPAAGLSRPAVARLLRRALHPQADQRVALPTFLRGLQGLLLDLQAPLSRAQAVGEVLGRFCPRASVDLLETDWGESTGDSLAALPPSLAPLSAVPVALSPTWYQRLAPPALPTPARSWLRSLRVLGGLFPLLAVSIWGIAALSTTEPAPPLPPLAASPTLPAGPAPAAAPGPMQPGAVPGPRDVRIEDAAAFPGVQLTLSSAEPRRPQDAPQRLLWVHVSNHGRTPQTIDLSQLRLRTAQGERLRPLAAATRSEWVTVGAGRRLSRRLAFGRDVSDTAAASPEVAGTTTTQRPTPNAITSR